MQKWRSSNTSIRRVAQALLTVRGTEAWTDVDKVHAKSEVERLRMDDSVLQYNRVMWDSSETDESSAESALSGR